MNDYATFFVKRKKCLATVKPLLKLLYREVAVWLPSYEGRLEEPIGLYW